MDHNKLWKVLQEIGIPDHLTCLLRNLHSGQEATVRTKHGTTDRFKIGKESKAVNCYAAYLACMQGKKQWLEPDMVLTWYKVDKGVK